MKPGQWNEAETDKGGERLDTAIARLFPMISRSRAQKLIDEGHVKWSGPDPVKASTRLSPGEKISVFLPAPKALDLAPQEIPLRIYHQDEHLAVIEKPAGLVVHPGAGHEEGTLVNALLHHFRDLPTGSGIGGELRPGIVHRIDRNTSGILLVTKTDLAHQHLSAQFKEHSISRRYLGLCWGDLPVKGEWNEAIARDPKERKRMALVDTDKGRRAVTRFTALKKFGPLSSFEAELLTGRTHQIRVHFAGHGLPLVGDEIYGNSTRSARRTREEGSRELLKQCPGAAALVKSLEEKGRQFLHAAHLGFTHPVSGERLEFHSELPSDLARVMVALSTWKK